MISIRNAVFAGALLSAALAAVAQVPGDNEFAMMDTNKDGKVSAAEHAAGAKSMFEQMDADRDGKVTATEMAAAHHAVTGKHAGKSDMSAADKIKAVDADGDGILTADEHAKASAAMFAKMDINHDGYLSKKEMAAGHARMMTKTAR
ncbi:MAG: hypothetical protein JWQ01_4548 [Massilia sp.]|jgi:hypothetical protein|nr:hypothetical protein [Massilia sp.]